MRASRMAQLGFGVRSACKTPESGTLFQRGLSPGWEGIYLIGDNVDPYNPKALRAAQGASLFLRWRHLAARGLFNLGKKEKLPLYLADCKGQAPSDL